MSESPQAKPRRRRRYYVILATAILLPSIIGILAFELYAANQNSYGPGPVEIEVAFDKAFYLQGEEVYFSIYVNNQQDWKVPRPSGITYQIKENDSFIDGYTVYSEFPPGPIPTFPARSRTLYNTYIWDQKTGPVGNRTQVQPGNYTFTVIFENNGLIEYGHGGNCIFEIQPNP